MIAYLWQELLRDLWHHPAEVTMLVSMTRAKGKTCLTEYPCNVGHCQCRLEMIRRERIACCGRGTSRLPIDLSLIDDLDAGVPRDFARHAAIAAANDEHLLRCFLYKAPQE